MVNKFLKILLLATSPLFVNPATALEVGDDGLHKTRWMQDTFKDLREDLEEANAEGKRLVYFLNKLGVFIAQKCTKRFFQKKIFQITLRIIFLWCS